jgi:hypothetical protein
LVAVVVVVVAAAAAVAAVVAVVAVVAASKEVRRSQTKRGEQETETEVAEVPT